MKIKFIGCACSLQLVQMGTAGMMGQVQAQTDVLFLLSFHSA